MKKTLFATSFVFIGLFLSTNIAGAANLNVGPYESFITINSALNSANAGDIINISSGTYNESLLISKPLTLTSSGARPIISGSGANYIIKIESVGGVVLNNLEINGGGSATEPNNFEYGVLINSAGTKDNPVEIKNSIVKNIWGASGNDIGVESSSYVLIHDNILNLFQKNGVRFVQSEGKFYGNTVNGDTVDGINRVQNLVNLRSNSNVEIYNNTIANGLTASPSSLTLFSPCIFVNAYPDGIASQALIYNNDISFCDVGIIITTKLISGDTSSAVVKNNNFHDLYLGVSFQQETGFGTMIDNSYTNVIKTSNRSIETKTVIPEPIKEEVVPPVVSVSIPAVEEKGVMTSEVPVIDEIPIVTEEPIIAPTQENNLAASVGNVMTLGTKNNLIGILGAFFLLIFVGFIYKKYNKQ